MQKFFKSWGFKVLCGLAVLAIAVMVRAAAVGDADVFLSQTFSVISQPFLKLSSSVSNSVNGFLDRFVRTEEVFLQNEELRKRVAQLEDANRQAETDSQENERLRSLLNLRQQRRDFTFESAKVTQYENSNWASTLTLNRGTSSGVAVNNCVVNETGALVGVVTEVGLNWCTVATVLDTQAQFGATVFRTGESAVAMGDLELMQSGKLKLSYLSGANTPVGGDLVLTSGLGGYYPSGLVIGAVEDVRTDDSGLTQYAVVQPTVTPSSLVEVFVITAFDIVD